MIYSRLLCMRKRSLSLLLPVLVAHLRDIEAVGNQIVSESLILLLDCVLTNRRQAPNQEGTYEAQG